MKEKLEAIYKEMLAEVEAKAATVPVPEYINWLLAIIPQLGRAIELCPETPAADPADIGPADDPKV